MHWIRRCQIRMANPRSDASERLDERIPRHTFMLRDSAEYRIQRSDTERSVCWYGVRCCAGPDASSVMWLATRCKREYCQRLPGHQPSADQRCRARVTECHRGRDEAISGGRTSIEANAFTASRTLREDAFGQALSAVAASAPCRTSKSNSFIRLSSAGSRPLHPPIRPANWPAPSFEDATSQL